MNSVMTCSMGMAGTWPAGQATPFLWVNTDLGPLSPFQKVQPGLKHLQHHVCALCV